jgi:hypothetical protein
VVIHAGKVVYVSSREAHDGGAAVRAPIHKRCYVTIIFAGNDHFRIADIAEEIIPRFRDLGFEAEVGPYRAAEDALLLPIEDLLTLEYAVWHSAEVRIRPDKWIVF